VVVGSALVGVAAIGIGWLIVIVGWYGFRRLGTGRPVPATSAGSVLPTGMVTPRDQV
jgi:hypothetical protein